MSSYIDRLDDLAQYLESSNIPYGQWGQNIHLLAGRGKDNAMGVDSDNMGHDGEGWDSDSGEFEIPPRMDYGRFDWAKANSLESEDEDDTDDETESSSAAAPSLDDFLRPPLARAPRFGITEAKRKTQNKLHHWGNFIACLSEKAGSELEQSCDCVKVIISLPAVSLNGVYPLEVG
jgi:hypothetical protein